MRLSVVVPCLNEEAVIDLFDARIRATLNSLDVDFELCYVDDGSSDTTLDRMRGLAQQHDNTRYVSFSRNFGKEAGMLAGMREATGDAVVLMDADLQHPPELLGRMLELYGRGHDQVVARRNRDGDRFARSLMSRLYYRLINKMVDVKLTDGSGDFRLLSRAAVDALLSLPEYNRFSKGLFAWIGFDTVTFDYRNVAREAGATKWRFGALLNYGIDGVISFNNRPLRLGIHVGLVLTALAVLYVVWIIVAALMVGIETPGYVTLLAAIVGLGGLQMVMLGLVGEYIGRIYYESKRRPHFLIRETNVPRETFRGQGAGSQSVLSPRATAPQPRSSEHDNVVRQTG
jgi:glycosyltransferase involved in cell wall biosynthesis